MSTVADYVGRRIDVSLFGNTPVSENDQRLLEQSIVQDGKTYVVTGIQKLVQRVLLRLFTVRGTRRYQPAEGCSFLSDALTKGFRTSSDVVSSFAAARAELLSLFASDHYLTDPPDEVLVNLTLNNVVLAADGIAISVTVTSAAGSSRRIITPLPIVT